MIAEAAGIVGELMFHGPPGAKEVNELAERGEHVHHAESRDSASHKRICEKGLQPRNRGGKVVALPERRPRDQNEQQTRFEQQGDEQQTPKQGE